MPVGDQLFCCIFFVTFRQGARVPSFGTQGCRNGNPPRLCAHTAARSGPSPSEDVRDEGFPSREVLRHIFLLIKCPLSFRLFLFHTPGYLALLPASEFRHCDKPLLSLLRPIGSCQSQLFFPRCCYSVLNGEAQLGEELLRAGSYDDGRLVFCKLATAGDNST
jgi:hypothetical protein